MESSRGVGRIAVEELAAAPASAAAAEAGAYAAGASVSAAGASDCAAEAGAYPAGASVSAAGASDCAAEAGAYPARASVSAAEASDCAAGASAGAAGASVSAAGASACAAEASACAAELHLCAAIRARFQRWQTAPARMGDPLRVGSLALATERGFTATELLVALAIAGLLLSLAVPGFASLARSAGLSSAANELMVALHTARATAVLRGVPVAVCLTADDNTCVSAPDAAATGWLVFVSDGSVAVSTRPAAVREVLGRFQLPDRLTVSASRPTVTFWPVARAAATSTFDLCDFGGAGRSIVVSQTGRPRVAPEATSCA